jgi:hypothetical protein
VRVREGGQGCGQQASEDHEQGDAFHLRYL